MKKLTTRQITSRQNKIKKYKDILYEEKLLFGYLDDSNGLRYAIAELYAEIEDFKGCLTYYRWFTENFPDDGAFPETFLIWTKALFAQGKLKEAHRKTIETALTNIYLIPFLLDLEMEDQNLPGYLSSMGADYADQAIPHFKYLMTPEFSEWLYNAYKSKEYQDVVGRYIELSIERDLTPESPERAALEEEISELRDSVSIA